MKVLGDNIYSWVGWGICIMVFYFEDCNKWLLIIIYVKVGINREYGGY